MGGTIFMGKHKTLVSNSLYNIIAIFLVLHCSYLNITSIRWVKHYLIKQILLFSTGIMHLYKRLGSIKNS